MLEWPGHGWYVVNRAAVIRGEDVRSATSSTDSDQPGRWETNFVFSQDGGNRFGKFTGANIGSNLAVVLDKQIVSVAVIQSVINDRGRINGLSTQQEAGDLATFLNTGALPARPLGPRGTHGRSLSGHGLNP